MKINSKLLIIFFLICNLFVGFSRADLAQVEDLQALEAPQEVDDSEALDEVAETEAAEEVEEEQAVAATTAKKTTAKKTTAKKTTAKKTTTTAKKTTTTAKKTTTTSKKTTTTSMKTTAAKSASPRPKTMCEQYGGNDQKAFMFTLIDGVFEKIMMGRLAAYFNGTTPTGSRDYLDPNNRDLLHFLVVRLVAFFGEILGCTEKGFPQFHRTGNFRRMHQRMFIDLADFELFNSYVLESAEAAGISSSDAGMISNVLNSFQSTIVFGSRKAAPTDTM
jgi:hypothetical protein